jgi:hypothetical protein
MTALLMTFTQNIMKETVMERHEIWLRLRRPALPGVPSMLDSLEVKVLYPT